MTGFALVRRLTPLGELTISLRSVNHRGLDLHFHLPSEFAIFENATRAALKQALGRGHVEIRMSLLRAPESAGRGYNRSLVENYIAAFREAATDNGIAQQPDLNMILGLPGALERTAETQSLDSSFGPELLAALEECVREFNQHREREGAALARELLEQASGIETAAQEIAGIRQSALPQFQQRLRERLSDLLGQSNIAESRLVEEAALLTDRSDIQEELTRLNIHSGELRRLLGEGGEIGKRLDFLLQEMNRETNTILSKTSGLGETGLGVTARALDIKAHIEKIREQALNVE